MKEIVRKELLLDIADSIINALSNEIERTTVLSEKSIEHLLKLSGNNDSLVNDVREWTVVAYIYRDRILFYLEDECNKRMLEFDLKHVSGLAAAKAILEVILDYVD